MTCDQCELSSCVILTCIADWCGFAQLGALNVYEVERSGYAAIPAFSQLLRVLVDRAERSTRQAKDVEENDAK